MKILFFWITLFFTMLSVAQNEQLAQNYFDRGDFEKAMVNYEDLLKSQPNNYIFFQRVVECQQQLSQFDKAQKAIQIRYDLYKQPALLIELGFNYQLQKDAINAKKYFDQAISKINENVSFVYGIANNFEKKSILDYALLAYQTAIKKQPDLNFNYAMAIIYGQQGNTDLMIEKFLNEARTNANSEIMIQNQLSRYMSEDGSEVFSVNLKKALLVRAQKSQDLFWNQYLSWYYVQLKEYGKAFIQEKAIYKRDPESFNNIVNLAQLAQDENDSETATEILTFVLANTNDLDLKIQSHTSLLQIKINKAIVTDYPIIEKEIDGLLKEFGTTPNTLPIQIEQANFLAFKRNKPEQAREILKNALQFPLNKYQEAELKMVIADIFLLEEKFNQALLNYTQIQEDLNQDEIGNEASLKAAKTSYFKSDFDWALQQFKALKSASSQLIANDALELFLLINDNKVSDSTYVALKKFARGDYLLYQNKTLDAQTQFLSILKENKGNEIEPAALLRLGKTFEKLGDMSAAILHYENIFTNFKECIYTDEALYFAAEIYFKHLNLPDKAKVLYEKIIFSHQDSIYFVDARSKFRQIRGDKEI